MLPRILSRRTLATAAIAVTAAAGSVAGASVAQGSGNRPSNNASAAPAPRSSILAGVDRILSGLVATGTITRQQADAVQAQADAGSIDPKQLVHQGVLTDAQTRVIAQHIDQLKFSYSQ